MENATGEDVLNRVWRTMKLHLKYHESFVKVHECLMKGDGPLNSTNRHFIAIMAASRHYCLELISHNFAILGEKTRHAAVTDVRLESWLNSGFRLHDASQKIQKLDKINMIMAHKPWMLTKDHIIELMQRCEDNGGGQRWSLSEVLQAITLLAHIHSFSSFVLGCGIMDDPQEENKTEISHEKEDGDSSNIPFDCHYNWQPVTTGSDESMKVPTIVAKMETLGAETEELEVSELTRRFEKIETSQAEDIVDLVPKDENAPIYRRSRSQTPSDFGSEGSNIETENKIYPDNFTDNLDSYQYVDFVKRENPGIYRTLRDGEFSWGEHAFSVISRFYGENIARILDKKFMTIDNLTYMNIGSYTSIDTR